MNLVISYSLLEQDWAETSVERGNTLGLHDLGETADETVGEGWVGNETDTCGLERAKRDVGEELSTSGGSKVDSRAVLGGALVTNKVDSLLLEELVTSELEGTLQEVTGGGWTETREEGTSTLLGNDLSEATNHALVVGDWVELNSGLDAVVTC